MIAVNIDWVIDWENVNKAVALIVSQEEPASLNITGADVDGLPDDCVIAAGSMLVSPTANYIAFEDGVFTEKSNSGGSGGGGGGESGIFIVNEEGSGPYVLDKTFREIVNALAAGKLAVVMYKNPEDEFGWETRLVTATYYYNEDEQNYAVDAGSYTYSCESPDDYPFAEG